MGGYKNVKGDKFTFCKCDKDKNIKSGKDSITKHYSRNTYSHGELEEPCYTEIHYLIYETWYLCQYTGTSD